MSAYYRVDFQVCNNEDLRQLFELTDTAGQAIDLSGVTLRMDIAATTGSAALEASSTNGRIAIRDAAAGRFELAIPAAIVRGLQPGTYRHDLVLSHADSVRRVWSGTISLCQGVTP